jgi:hypothetical protein
MTDIQVVEVSQDDMSRMLRHMGKLETGKIFLSKSDLGFCVVAYSKLFGNAEEIYRSEKSARFRIAHFWSVSFDNYSYSADDWNTRHFSADDRKDYQAAYGPGV